MHYNAEMTTVEAEASESPLNQPFILTDKIFAIQYTLRAEVVVQHNEKTVADTLPKVPSP